jgi:hypothetical protein
VNSDTHVVSRIAALCNFVDAVACSALNHKQSDPPILSKFDSILGVMARP